MRKGWGDLITINNDDSDRTELRKGLYRRHPRVYSGFFQHSNFAEAQTNINVQVGTDDEFRSNDWVFMPGANDMRPWSDINAGWSYGAASTTPVVMADRVICT